MNSKFKKFIEIGNSFWIFPSYYISLFCWAMGLITHHFYPDAYLYKDFWNSKINKWDLVMQGASSVFMIDIILYWYSKGKNKRRDEELYTKKNPWGDK